MEIVIWENLGESSGSPNQADHGGKRRILGSRYRGRQCGGDLSLMTAEIQHCLLQPQGVSSNLLHETEEHREENLCGTQEIDGNVRDRRQISVRQVGQRSANLWSSLLSCKSKSVFNFTVNSIFP